MSMRQENSEENIADTAFHVSDCRVWAEIYYLDSPTDYGEFIEPGEPKIARGGMAPRPRITTDSSAPAMRGERIFLVYLPILLITLVILSYIVGWQIAF
jgi:hypothetical protein